MSHEQRKKKRLSGMFDLDRIEATEKSNTAYLQDVREHMKALSEIDLERIM